MADSFVVDIVMPSCSLDESDPLTFISTEDYLIPMVRTYMAVFGYFQIRNQDVSSILYIGLSIHVRKCLKKLDDSKEIIWSRK